MLEWLFSKPKYMTRDALRMSISRQCNIQDFIPLNRVYKLVPDLQWLKRRTPSSTNYVKDYNDCNHVACVMMARAQTHCVGMAIVGTTDPLVDHCYNIVMLENLKLYLYDPRQRTLTDANYGNVKRIWL